MRIGFVIPRRGEVRTGNRCTAEQWVATLQTLGHSAEVLGDSVPDDLEALVVLHGLTNRDALLASRARRPERPLILVLTGTDLYGEEDRDLLSESMQVADRIVVLQARAEERVPEVFRAKVRVIVQSAIPSAGQWPEATGESFPVCVVGHLRDVKDPLRAAAAARLLPRSSTIRILQAGAILEDKYRALVETEMRENPRYEWLGEMNQTQVRTLIAGSRLMVLSSFLEGGARVVGESMVEGTPVLTTRTDGVLGLLGDSYPGFYPVGDTEALAQLLQRAETEPEFYRQLEDEAGRLAPRFDPSRETEAWRSLLEEMQGLLRTRKA